MTAPILWSFRRCPYAMRARLAIAKAGVRVELREIVLRAKPEAFLALSPSGTVPSLAVDGSVIDESLDIMRWALAQNDPDHWLDMPDLGWDLIAVADGPFKAALDRTKYASRYPNLDASEARDTACGHLQEWNALLSRNGALTGPRLRLADMAILPFVRQFAMIDKAWFDAQPWPQLSAWLDQFLVSSAFLAIMHKYPPWHPGDAPTPFP